MRKFPKMVPRNIGGVDRKLNAIIFHASLIHVAIFVGIFSYLEPLLVGDRCQREAAPSAYDNALST